MSELSLAPLDREEYPVGSIVRVENMTPLERAWAEAEHDGCEEEPIGHPLSAHAPWSGGDLDGVETWPSFMARLARHGLTLRLSGDDEGLHPDDGHDHWYACIRCGVDNGINDSGDDEGLRAARRLVDEVIYDLPIGEDVTYSRGYSAGVAAARESLRAALQERTEATR